jgi:hypothetical protein
MAINNFTECRKLIQMKLHAILMQKLDVENARMILPTKSLSTRFVLIPCVIQKIKAIISEKWTPRFPINTNRSLKLSKIPETLTLR